MSLVRVSENLSVMQIIAVEVVQIKKLLEQLRPTLTYGTSMMSTSAL